MIHANKKEKKDNKNEIEDKEKREMGCIGKRGQVAVYR